MNREGHENTSFFTGTEVEHTPAFGLKTLFVVGTQSVEDIANHLHGCEHIYFGANQSFPKYLDINDSVSWSKWDLPIRHFLDLGYWCTLDIDVANVEGMLEGMLTEYHNFIPMISVKLPYIQQLGYNAIIKLDDKDFRATNPGVWCHSVHDLQKRSVFTDWSKYTKDEII
jgi:hypothetical protein